MSVSLNKIHQELESKGFRELFAKGWAQWTKNPESSCKRKSAFFAGSIFALTYTGSAFLFGSLALQQAAEERKGGASRSPIIGHFAEWTMLGTFALIVFARIPYEIAELGRMQEIDLAFDTQLQQALPTDQCEIYNEKLRFLRQCAQKFFFPRLLFPKSSINLQTCDVLNLDSTLAADYRDIETELEVSSLQLIQEGWEQISSRYSSCQTTLLKTALLAAMVLALFQTGIYSMGIVESGAQAFQDYQDGIIPSIGGHSLEWTAEIVGVGALFFQIFSEIVNVGKAKRLASAIHAKIDSLRNGQDLLAQEKISRLKEVLADTFDSLPTAYLFTPPSSLRYQ